MKEIKLRAWDKVNARMVTVAVVHPGGWMIDTEGYMHAAGNYELVEYTGLKDKNGKEIYEGDVVQLGAYSNCQKEWLPTHKCEVKFTLEHGGYSVSTPYTDSHFNDFEAKHCGIIGNIHENPDLI